MSGVMQMLSKDDSSSANATGNPTRFVGVVLLLTCLFVSPMAFANVQISSAATSNMVCGNGQCVPTAADAVLNVTDLETLLASGSVEVTTTGSGVQANNIEIDAPLSWASMSALALDAYQKILVNKPVMVSGAGGLSIAINDGGSSGYFGFGAKGHVTLSNLSSALTIDGAAYTLESDIQSLANAISNNSAGDYALANDYDASNDGTYQDSPVPTEFSGHFEGLGNTISHLSLNGSGNVNSYVGLFAELALDGQPGGSVENITLRKLNIGGNGAGVGGLVGLNLSSVSGVYVSGTLTTNIQECCASIGGMVSSNFGSIVRSGAGVTINGWDGVYAGGLVGGSLGGTVTQSYANSVIFVGDESIVGGLAGDNGPTSESYATGTLRSGSNSKIGGLIGGNDGPVSQAYSTSAISQIRNDHYRGGFIGYDSEQKGGIKSSYWDITTSHIKSLRRGAGYPRNDPGITGLTTQQLRSGLPQGFDPTVWAQDPKINNGFPYLIANPPRD